MRGILGGARRTARQWPTSLGIDRGNPLCKGLVAALSASDLSRATAVAGPVLTTYSDSVFGASIAHLANASGRYFAPTPQVFGSQLTLLCIGLMPSGSTSGNSFLGAIGSVASDDTFGIQTASSTTPARVFFRNLSGTVTSAESASLGTDVSDTQAHVWVATWDGTQCTLYRDGLDDTAGRANSSASGAYSNGGNINLGGVERPTNPQRAFAVGQYQSLVVAWNRRLSPTEIRRLSRNPWQVFAPPVRRLLVALLGGTAFNAAMAEAATLTDASAAVAAFSAAEAESGTLSHAQAATAAFSSAQAEAPTIAHAQTATAAFAGSEAETVSATDASAAIAAFSAAEAESLTPTDVVAFTGGAQSAALAEAATVTDGSAATAAFQGVEAESLVASDGAAGTAAFQAAEAESLTGTDTVAFAGGAQSGSMGEAATLTDAQTATAAFAVAAAEAPTLSDARAAAAGFSAAVAESAAPAESTSALAAFVATVSEAISAIDLVAWVGFFIGNMRVWRPTARARAWWVASRARAWVAPPRARYWRVKVCGVGIHMSTQEKRLSESVTYDFDCSLLLAAGETISSVTSVSAEPTTSPAIALGTAAVNAVPITYADGHVAPIGQVIQVRISGGAIAAGNLSQTYLMRAKFVTSLNPTIEANGYLRVNDTPAA